MAIRRLANHEHAPNDNRFVTCGCVLAATRPGTDRAAQLNSDWQPLPACPGPIRPRTGGPGLRLDSITVAIRPTPERKAALEQLLERQRDPKSPDYRRWLTPEEFGIRFGAPDKDLAALRTWLESQGLHIDETARGRQWFVVSGSAATVSNAFQTPIHRFETGGRVHFANTLEPSLPEDIARLVLSIRGLDDFYPEPQARPAPRFSAGGNNYYLAPGDISTIYDIRRLYAAGIDGTGQTIAVVGQTQVFPNDVRLFRQKFGLPQNDPVTIVDGPDPGISQGDLLEANLDLDWAGAVAPKAAIRFVIAKSAFLAAGYAIDNMIAPVVSMSYGGCEADNSAFWQSDQMLAQRANSHGITWVAASGDSGAAGCDPQGATAAVRGLAVQLPSSIPEVTGVGGTQLQGAFAQTNGPDGGSALWTIPPESVWNETFIPYQVPGNLASAYRYALHASGGGASVYFPKPDWQTGPGVPNDVSRDVPDVAMAASTNIPYIVIQNQGQQLVGGTSAAAPVFAGILALLNQYLVNTGIMSSPGLSNINPRLYQLAQFSSNVFNDVVAGDNGIHCLAGSPNCDANQQFGYPAGPGYDLATGLGSVDAYELATNWALPNAQLSVAYSGTLVAGNGNPGSTGDGGQATAASVTASQMALDGAGALYLLNPGVQLRRVTPDGVISTVSSQFVPATLSTDPTGQIWLGKNKLTAPLPASPPNVSSGDTVTDPQGFTYSAGVTKTSPLGATLSVATTTGTPALIDYAGNLVLFQQATCQYARLLADGSTSALAGSGCYGAANAPGSAASVKLSGTDRIGGDPFGNLFILDNGVLRKVTPDGQISRVLFTGGPKVLLPIAMQVDSAGRIWIINRTYLNTSATAVDKDQVYVFTPQPVGPVLVASMTHQGTVQGGQSNIPLSITVSDLAGAGPTTDSVSVTVTFPAGVTLNTMGGNGWTCGGNICVRPDVVSGGQSYPPIQATVNIAANAPSPWVIQALVTGGGAAPVAASDTAVASQSCPVTLSAGGSAYPKTAVTTAGFGFTVPAGCKWTVSTSASWITVVGSTGSGSGNAGLSIAANTSYTRAAYVSIATRDTAQSFIVQQAGATAVVGTLAHFAIGGGWQSSLTLVSLYGGATATETDFFADDGSSAFLPLTSPTPIPSTVNSPPVVAGIGTLGYQYTSVVLVANPPLTAPTQTGSARLGLKGFEIFRYNPSGQEAAVPIETRTAQSWLLPFDNTSGLATGLAVAARDATTTTVPVIVRDDAGNQIQTDTITFPAGGHTSFMLNDRYPKTAAKRGSVEFTGGVVIGLRANGAALTTIPVIAKDPTIVPAGGRMAHVVAGGGWTMIFTIANPGKAAASAQLTFLDDTGLPLQLSMVLPQTGLQLTASALTQTVPAGGVLVVQATGVVSGTTSSGSAQLAGAVDGFAIFRYDPWGQEAVVPLDRGNWKVDQFVAFDNTSGVATGLALTNVTAKAVSVPIVVHSEQEAPIVNDMVVLPANSHTSFVLTDRWPATANTRGLIHVQAPGIGGGSGLSVVGIRVSGGKAITTLPVLVP